jgi:hypothetical protein
VPHSFDREKVSDSASSAARASALAASFMVMSSSPVETPEGRLV